LRINCGFASIDQFCRNVAFPFGTPFIA